VLLVLLQRPGETVAKDQIMTAVWPDTIVEEGNLTQMIFLLRKALADPEKGQYFISTAPRQGYRLVGQIAETPPAQPPRHRLWLAAAAGIIALFCVAGVWVRGRATGQTISAIAVL